MKQRKANIDKSHIEFKTNMAKGHADSVIEFANKILHDPDQQNRQLASMCPVCYYSESRIGGAAITTRECGICETEMTFGSTSTDELCCECAKRNKLCRQCGGDVDMKHRRKPREDV